MGLFSWLFGRLGRKSSPASKNKDGGQKLADFLNSDPEATPSPSNTNLERQPIELPMMPARFSREDLKEAVRSLDPDAVTACPVCRAQIKVKNLIWHYDNQHSATPAKKMPSVDRKRKRVLVPQRTQEQPRRATTMETCHRCGKAGQPLKKGAGMMLGTVAAFEDKIMKCSKCATLYCGNCAGVSGPYGNTTYQCPNCKTPMEPL
jgi:hypothetical protein